MKIIVCIKRVPDTESRIRIAEDGISIDPAGIKYIISPYDEFALEMALRLKESKGTGEVLVVSAGGATSAEQLRSALAMGADRALLLKTDTSLDGLATAKALAGALAGESADLILLGMKAVDGDQQQVGPMLGVLLDLPCITVAASFEIEGASVVAQREIEGGIEVVEAPLPAIVTVTKGEHEPRYPSLKGIMAAKKKPLEERIVEPAAPRVRVGALSYPPERPPGRIVGRGVDAVPELVRLLHEEARVI